MTEDLIPRDIPDLMDDTSTKEIDNWFDAIPFFQGTPDEWKKAERSIRTTHKPPRPRGTPLKWDRLPFDDKVKWKNVWETRIELAKEDKKLDSKNNTWFNEKNNKLVLNERKLKPEELKIADRERKKKHQERDREENGLANGNGTKHRKKKSVSDMDVVQEPKTFPKNMSITDEETGKSVTFNFNF